MCPIATPLLQSPPNYSSGLAHPLRKNALPAQFTVQDLNPPPPHPFDRCNTASWEKTNNEQSQPPPPIGLDLTTLALCIRARIPSPCLLRIASFSASLVSIPAILAVLVKNNIFNLDNWQTPTPPLPKHEKLKLDYMYSDPIDGKASLDPLRSVQFSPIEILCTGTILVRCSTSTTPVPILLVEYVPTAPDPGTSVVVAVLIDTQTIASQPAIA